MKNIMAVKGNAHGRRLDESSFHAKMQKTERANVDVFQTRISRHQDAIEKRHEVPNCSGSIWDFNPGGVQEVSNSFQKTNSKEFVAKRINSNYLIKTALKQLSNANDGKISKQIQSVVYETPDFLDELFPDLVSYARITITKPAKMVISRNSKSKPSESLVESRMCEKSTISIGAELYPKSSLPENNLKSSKVGVEEALNSEKKSKTPHSSLDEIYLKPSAKKIRDFESVVESKLEMNDSDFLKNEESTKRIQTTSLIKSCNKPPMIQSSKPYDGYQPDPRKNVLFTAMISKTPSPSKSTINRKSFEEWSSERLLNKSSPSKDQPRPISPIKVKSPAIKPVTKKLVELESDYFYGVKSEVYMDFDYDENFPDLANEEMIECSKGNAKPVRYEKTHELCTKESPEYGKRFCQVSKLMEKFAKDTTDPLSQDFLVILEKMRKQGRFDAKSMSRTSKSPKVNFNSRRNGRNTKFNSQLYNQSRNSKDFLKTSDAMVSLQVTDRKNNTDEELIVLGMEVYEIKENFPWIFNAIPAVDVEDISLPYSACAMAIVFKCVFQKSYRFPSWDVAVEVYAVAKEYRVLKLVESCIMYFNHNPIKIADFMKFTQLVRHFEAEELLQNATTYQVSERPIFESPSAIQIQSCIITCNTLKKPSEFSVPLFYSKGDLGSIRTSDFHNEMEIESVQGVYYITGVQIAFEVNSSDKGKALPIVCEILKGEKILDLEQVVELQSKVVINFKKNICLRPKESVKLIFEIEDIKSSWCQCLKEDKLEYKNENGVLRARFKSHNRNSAKRSLFFIDKVFYMN